MNLSRIAWLVGVALLVLVVNVVLSIVYMVVYSYLIDPGHDKAYYDAHIQVAAPYCSIVAGIPLMFFAGWWTSGWWGGENAIRSAVIVWVAYAVIDLAIIISAGATAKVGLLVGISLLSKLAAVVFGSWVRTRNA